MMELIIFFTLGLVDTCFKTCKTMFVSRGTPLKAAIWTSMSIAFYSLVVRQMSELPQMEVFCLSFIYSFIGVYVVKYILELQRQDKLWLIKATMMCSERDAEKLQEDLKINGIGSSYIQVGKRYIFEIFSYNREQSSLIKSFIELYHGKYIVLSSKQEL